MMPQSAFAALAGGIRSVLDPRLFASYHLDIPSLVSQGSLSRLGTTRAATI